ncbi:MAG TPA: DUF433 domain-containing protein [Longimicrobium sp.]
MAGDIVHDGATGQAIVASTGTPVDTILEALQAGDSHDDVLRAHPGLTADDIVAAVRFARGAVQRGVRYSTGDEMPRTGGFSVHEAAAYGRSSVDAAEHEELLYRLDIVEGINAGLLDVAAGRTIAHNDAVAFLREHIAG